MWARYDSKRRILIISFCFRDDTFTVGHHPSKRGSELVAETNYKQRTVTVVEVFNDEQLGRSYALHAIERFCFSCVKYFPPFSRLRLERVRNSAHEIQRAVRCENHIITITKNTVINTVAPPSVLPRHCTRTVRCSLCPANRDYRVYRLRILLLHDDQRAGHQPFRQGRVRIMSKGSGFSKEGVGG